MTGWIGGREGMQSEWWFGRVSEMIETADSFAVTSLHRVAHAENLSRLRTIVPGRAGRPHRPCQLRRHDDGSTVERATPNRSARLELGNHGEHVEQQPADRIGRVAHRPAQIEPNLPNRELVRVALASGSDRVSRSSLVTTRVSPSRQAARASRRPGRSLFVPVSRWST
jgi:hypothetical protein